MKRSPLVVIFTTVFIDLVGFGIVMPVLPFYAESPDFRASPRMIGLLIASYSVMQLIFSPILGRLSDKHGRRPVLLYSIIGTGIGFLVLGFANTLWMLFLGRILDGISGGNISTAQAYIADITTKEDRAKGMGLLGAAFGLGFIFGPAIGGILSRWGVHVPFLFAAGLAFANAVLLYFTLPETVTPDHPARVSAAGGRGFKQLFESLKEPRLGFVVIIYFLFIVAFSIMTTAFALYTMFRFGFDAHHNGYLFAYVGIIAVIIQGGLIGRLVKRFGEMPLVIVGASGVRGQSFCGAVCRSCIRRSARVAHRWGHLLFGKLALGPRTHQSGVQAGAAGSTRNCIGRHSICRQSWARSWSIVSGAVNSQWYGLRRSRRCGPLHERSITVCDVLGRGGDYVCHLSDSGLFRAGLCGGVSTWPFKC